MNVLTFFVTFIRMSGRGRGCRHSRRGRQEMPLLDDIPTQQEGVGQAIVAEPVGQEAMGTLARGIADALRESMGILRAENPVQAQVQAPVVDAGPSFLKREFFQANPDEFVGDPKEPLKADEWVDQMTKTVEMLGIEDGALKVTLASFQLKGGASQWWKYMKGRIAARGMHLWSLFKRNTYLQQLGRS